MKPFLCIILGMIVVLSVGYGAHDLTCYAVIEPGGDYVQADSAIIPKLGIANLGDEAELNFAFHFIAIDEEEGDTVFADITIVDYIGPYPDSVEVEFDEWVPEGICDPYSPFVEYEFIGVVDLETDEDRENDSLSDIVTCLLSHDVGVVDFEILPYPDIPPCTYNAGSVITVTAVVENFGNYAEHNVPVRLEILDITADPDTLCYVNLRAIDFIDWRGNSLGNTCVVDVVFPVWTFSGGSSNLADYRFIFRTEMIGDECSDEDEMQYQCWEGVDEDQNLPLTYSLELKEQYLEEDCYINLTVPHESWVKLDVFDVNGRWVKTIKNDLCKPGYYNMTWDCQDAAGRKVATGVYLIRMQADEFKAVRKIVIMN
jgi:hypothetical protein